jgi:hypothetical protein
MKANFRRSSPKRRFQYAHANDAIEKRSFGPGKPNLKTAGAGAVKIAQPV